MNLSIIAALHSFLYMCVCMYVCMYARYMLVPALPPHYYGGVATYVAIQLNIYNFVQYG